jgi:hypothetical protein
MTPSHRRFVSKVREAQEAGASLAEGERDGSMGPGARVGAPTAAVLYPAGFKGRTHSVGEPRSRAPGLPGGMAIGTAGNYVSGQSRQRVGSDAAGSLGGYGGNDSGASPPIGGRGAAGENMRQMPRVTYKEGGDEGVGSGWGRGWAATVPGEGTAAPGEHSLRTNNGSNSSAVSRATTAAHDRPSSATERPFSAAHLPAAHQTPSPPVGSARPSSAVKRLPERPTTASSHSRRFYEQEAAQQETSSHAPVRPQSHFAQRDQPPAAPPAPSAPGTGHLPERSAAAPSAPSAGARDEVRAARPEWEKPRAEVVAAGSRDAPHPGAVGDLGALTIKPASFNEHQVPLTLNTYSGGGCRLP